MKGKKKMKEMTRSSSVKENTFISKKNIVDVLGLDKTSYTKFNQTMAMV